MPVVIPSNDASFEDTSSIVIEQFGSGPNAFIGIDVHGALVDPIDETHAIINVDKAEFVKQVREFLDEVEVQA